MKLRTWAKKAVEAIRAPRNRHVRKAKPKRTSQWTTRDGRVIRVCDMDDTHLANTIRYLERTQVARREHEIHVCMGALSTLHGEMAIDCAERELDGLMDDFNVDAGLPNIYFEMCDEAEERGLLPDYAAKEV